MSVLNDVQASALHTPRTAPLRAAPAVVPPAAIPQHRRFVSTGSDHRSSMGCLTPAPRSQSPSPQPPPPAQAPATSRQASYTCQKAFPSSAIGGQRLASGSARPRSTSPYSRPSATCAHPQMPPLVLSPRLRMSTSRQQSAPRSSRVSAGFSALAAQTSLVKGLVSPRRRPSPQQSRLGTAVAVVQPSCPSGRMTPPCRMRVSAPDLLSMAPKYGIPTPQGTCLLGLDKGRAGDSLAQQLRALHQAKGAPAAQQTLGDQHQPSAQQALSCRDAAPGLTEALRRWPSPRTWESSAAEPLATPRLQAYSAQAGPASFAFKACPPALQPQGDGARAAAAHGGAQACAPRHQPPGAPDEHQGQDVLSNSVETDGTGMPLKPQQAKKEHHAAAPRKEPHDADAGMPLKPQQAKKEHHTTAPRKEPHDVGPVVGAPTADPLHVAGGDPATDRGGAGAERCRAAEADDVGHPESSAAPAAGSRASPRTVTPASLTHPRDNCRSSRDSCTTSTAPWSPEAQAELDRCRGTILSCVQALSPKHLRELRGFRNPPSVIKSVLEATAIVLGAPDTQLSTVRKTLQANLPERLRSINPEDVTLAQYRRLRKLLSSPDFSEEFVRGVCSTAVPLAVWCRAIGTCVERIRSWSGSEVGAAAHHQPQKPAEPDDAQKPEAHDPAKAQGLTIVPDVAKLAARERKQVCELVVSRPDIGSIVFHGTTDCTDLDIPSLVHLDVGEVLVYPVQGSKPLPGQGLNKCATVTMYQCWPPNGRGHLEDVKAQERYRGKIQKMTEDKNAKFIDYDCNTGIWKFQVEHF